MPEPEAVVCSPVRSRAGRFGGALRDLPAPELGRRAVEAVVARSGAAADKANAAIMGNVIQAGARMTPARRAAPNGGPPESAPAMTVNRVRGCGARAIAGAAMEVARGHADCVMAGGTESMDQGRQLLDKARWGCRMGPGRPDATTLRDGPVDVFSGERAGWQTEDLVTETQITREAQEEWAARSQKRVSLAGADGRFEDDIIPVALKGRRGEETLDQDEASRPDARLGSGATLRPVFPGDATVTAGNAPGLNDAAAAIVVARRDRAEAEGLTAEARLVAHGVGAGAPGMFGLGPVPAVHQAPERAGWLIGDLERVRINEAPAAIVIALTRRLELAEAVVNVEGGAIAHGQSIGATGAILAARLLHSMRRDGLCRGLVMHGIGGGQGIAWVFERRQ